MGMPEGDKRQVTANVGHIREVNSAAKMHGLGQFYYSMPIEFKKNEFEQKMLGYLHQNDWTNSLKMDNFTGTNAHTVNKLKEFTKLTDQYNKWI